MQPDAQFVNAVADLCPQSYQSYAMKRPAITMPVQSASDKPAAIRVRRGGLGAVFQVATDAFMCR